MAKELTSVSYLITENGPIPLSEVPPDVMAAASKAMTERVNRSMAEYYRNNYQEYIEIAKTYGKAVGG